MSFEASATQPGRSADAADFKDAADVMQELQNRFRGCYERIAATNC
jgi:hypothetical protein